jgi:hypothetical protein
MEQLQLLGPVLVASDRRMSDRNNRHWILFSFLDALLSSYLSSAMSLQRAVIPILLVRDGLSILNGSTEF